MIKRIILFILTSLLIGSCKQETRKLPVLYDGNIYINCMINDSIHANFKFDIGANEICLDSVFNLKAGLNYPDNVFFGLQQEVLPKGYRLDSPFKPFKLSFDTLTYFPKDLQVLNLKRSLGKHCDGLVGWEFLRRYIVEINYEDCWISLHLPNESVIDSTYSKIPFFCHEEKWFVPLQIKLPGNTLVSGNFLFDTGYLNSVLLSDSTARKFQIDAMPTKKLMATDTYLSAYNVKAGGYVFRGLSIQLGKIEIVNPILERSSVDVFNIECPDYRGLLGNKVLERFHVIIDFPNKQLFLKPNKKFATKMDFITPGFGIKEDLNGTGNFIVTSIFRGTQAERLGIKPADTIVKINGRACHDLKRGELKTLMNPDHEILFTIKRNKEERSFRVTIINELN